MGSVARSYRESHVTTAVDHWTALGDVKHAAMVRDGSTPFIGGPQHLLARTKLCDDGLGLIQGESLLALHAGGPIGLC
jgi:hypothetical protein